MRPFFLDRDSGRRFCVAFEPEGAGSCRGGVLLAPAFAEEMHKSRRMTALQARALAEQGYMVLSIDLLGSGDSAGDFSDATWDAWKDDLAAGLAWLETHVARRPSLWGVRLGCLLGLDFAQSQWDRFARVVLWQPAPSGKTFLTQFLRLVAARAALRGKPTGSGTEASRARLASGRPQEVAGYTLSTALVRAIDGQRLADLAPVGAECHWLTVLSTAADTLGPAEQAVVDAWRQHGVDLHVTTVSGDPFWRATYEIAECPALLAATSAIFA